MIKYMIFGLVFVVLALSYVGGEEEAEKSDLEAQDFLFRPVYIRYGYHPHNSYGWKGVGQQHHHQPYGYGWGSYHHGGLNKKASKKKRKALKKKQKAKRKALKKANKKGGGGWGQQGWGGGGWGGAGGGYGGGGYGGYGGFEE